MISVCIARSHIALSASMPRNVLYVMRLTIISKIRILILQLSVCLVKYPIVKFVLAWLLALCALLTIIIFWILLPLIFRIYACSVRSLNAPSVQILLYVHYVMRLMGTFLMQLGLQLLISVYYAQFLNVFNVIIWLVVKSVTKVLVILLTRARLE